MRAPSAVRLHKLMPVAWAWQMGCDWRLDQDQSIYASRLRVPTPLARCSLRREQLGANSQPCKFLEGNVAAQLCFFEAIPLRLRAGD